MQLEVGSILEGKVTGITKFGAFVDLGSGKSGMVHISEVAPTYVKEITDHVQQGQTVKVKILGITPEGKISLSIKKAMPQEENAPRPPRRAPFRDGEQREHRPYQGGRNPSSGRGASSVGRSGPGSYEWTPRQQNENMSFEDMMSKFKAASDDKMSDLKKYMDVKSSRKGQR